MSKETLSYWKNRYALACNNYDKSGTKADREDRLLCNRMVNNVEKKAFKS